MTSRYDALVGRMRAGETILIDGATGTEVERRGAPRLQHAWSAAGADTHPDILRAIHEDYIDAGACIVISNTFGTTRHALRDEGLADRFETLNRRSVELAVEARDNRNRDEVLVAGGISYWSWSGNHPPLPELRDSITRQASVMVEAGAELLMLEMMIDIDRMSTTLEASSGAGVPVWVGVTTKVDDDGEVCLRNGESFDTALDFLEPFDVPLISVMHTPLEVVAPSLDVLDERWRGLVGVYAHTGSGADPVSPQTYCDAAQEWLARDIHLIGGCCGIGVPHIELLAKQMTA